MRVVRLAYLGVAPLYLRGAYNLLLGKLTTIPYIPLVSARLHLRANPLSLLIKNTYYIIVIHSIINILIKKILLLKNILYSL